MLIKEHVQSNGKQEKLLCVQQQQDSLMNRSVNFELTVVTPLAWNRPHKRLGCWSPLSWADFLTDSVCVLHCVSPDQYILIFFLSGWRWQKVHHSVPANLPYKLSKWVRMTCKGKVSTYFMDLLGICVGGWSGPWIRTIYQAKERMRYSCSTAVFVVAYVEASNINKNSNNKNECQHPALMYICVLLKLITSDYPVPLQHSQNLA